MLGRYDTDQGLKALCEDCAQEREDTDISCRLVQVPPEWEQVELECQDCNITFEELIEDEEDNL